MSVRDKIADIVRSRRHSNDNSAMITDAIIAALPDMIKPLVWDKHPDDQEWYCKLTEIEGEAFERGYMIYPSRSGFVLFFGFDHAKRKMGYFILATEAKAAANAHYVATIMGAFE